MGGREWAEVPVTWKLKIRLEMERAAPAVTWREDGARSPFCPVMCLRDGGNKGASLV